MKKLEIFTDGTDELNLPERSHRDRRGRPPRRTNPMSISLTKVTKPFNAANNVPSGYKTNCTNR